MPRLSRLAFLVEVAALTQSATSFTTQSFTPVPFLQRSSLAAGKGFGNPKPTDLFRKTYEEDATISPLEVIDPGVAMSEFFSANDQWHPLFRSLIDDDSAPAVNVLGGSDAIVASVEYTDDTPWKKLDSVPSDEAKLEYLATFLDKMQHFLVEMPVDEAAPDDDELDLNFIEEGRRINVLQRFHVIDGVAEDGISQHDQLFMMCWSELSELKQANEPDTGSLIVLPEYDMADLRQFANMNLHWPLDWLNLSTSFEVSVMNKGIPAIRLIHKLSDIPEPEQS